MPKRSEIHFNQNTVKTNRPQEKRYEIWDAGHKGLFLRVLPTGTKNFFIALDRRTVRKIGDANLLTVGQARNKATTMSSDHIAGKTKKSSRNQCPTLQKFLKGKYQDYVKANHKTGTSDVERLLSCCKTLLKTRLNQLSEFQIEKWKAGRLKVAKPNTVKRDLGSLKGALNLAVKWGIISMNPSSPVIVKVPNEHRVRYLSDKERERLLEALSERDKDKARARQRGNVFSLARGREARPEISGFADFLHPLVLTVLHTGMRRNEALTLQWDQVRLGNNPRLTVTASYAKSGRVRHIPLNSEVVKVLKNWKAQGTGTGWVFPSPKTGGRMHQFRKSWLNLLVKADIQDFRFHDTRHTFASNLVANGVDLYRVRDLLGHSTIQVTERYSHLSKGVLAEAVEVLSNG